MNNGGRYLRSRTCAVSLHKSPGSKGTTLDLCRYERRNRRTIIVFVIYLCCDNPFERTIVLNWPCSCAAHANCFRWSNNVQVNKITLPIYSVQRFICPHNLRLLLNFYTRQEILGLYVRLTIRAERDNNDGSRGRSPVRGSFSWSSQICLEKLNSSNKNNHRFFKHVPWTWKSRGFVTFRSSLWLNGHFTSGVSNCLSSSNWLSISRFSITSTAGAARDPFC